MDSPIYLDHNATSPLAPEVAQAMAAAYSAQFANPASQHEPGRVARRVLESARERIIQLLGFVILGKSAYDGLPSPS